MNERIRGAQVRVVGADGEQIGIRPLAEALRLARERDLDLVEVAPNANPPVCRIMDYGRYRYQQDLKAKEARRRQSHIVIKEIKMRPKIDAHDYTTKKRHVERFLREGSKVKATIMFRGREMTHPERGRLLLERLASDITSLGSVETAPNQEGRNMSMVIAPHKHQPQPGGVVAGGSDDSQDPRPTEVEPRGMSSEATKPLRSQQALPGVEERQGAVPSTEP